MCLFSMDMRLEVESRAEQRKGGAGQRDTLVVVVEEKRGHRDCRWHSKLTVK